MRNKQAVLVSSSRLPNLSPKISEIVLSYRQKFDGIWQIHERLGLSDLEAF